jgi:hypothetical protein
MVKQPETLGFWRKVRSCGRISKGQWVLKNFLCLLDPPGLDSMSSLCSSCTARDNGQLGDRG